MKYLSILIPAFNEANFIEENINELDGFLKERYKSYEIIVSEDGSTDGTDRILRKLSASGKIVHLHSNRRLGKGGAIKKAFLSSSGRRVFFTDADFPMDMRNMPEMINLLDKYDIVVGSRMKKGASADRSIKRRMFSIAYNSLVRISFRTGIRDHQCGVKAFRRDSTKDIFSNLSSAGFFWDTELLVRARSAKLSIYEVPIVWKENRLGKSKVSLYKGSYSMAKSLLTFWYRINFGNEK